MDTRACNCGCRRSSSHRQRASQLCRRIRSQLAVSCAVEPMSPPVSAKIRMNPDLAPYSLRQEYNVRTWQGNGEDRHENARWRIHGIDSCIRSDRHSDRRHSSRSAISAGVLVPGQALSDKSYAESETPFGKLTGMLLSFGSENTSAYVWLTATEKEVRTARLHYRLGTGIGTLPRTRSIRTISACRSTQRRRRFLIGWKPFRPPEGAELKSEIVELRR